MFKHDLMKKMLLAVVCALFVATSSTSAFARDRGGSRDTDRGRDWGRSRPHEVVVVNNHRYNYRDGRFYRPGWFGFEFVIGFPPIGAIVTSIPISHRTMVVGGASYYYYENIYYKTCPTGYIVVPAPTAAPVVYAPQQDAITINVPNSNGSYTQVTLVKRGDGYVGPQGEYYPQNPTVEQLKALYGR
jgi:hypothetical protein